MTTFSDDDIRDAERFAPCAECGVTAKLYLLFEPSDDTPDHHFRCWECSKEEQPRRARAIVKLAREDGHEIDDAGVVKISEGSDNGAYIQAWVWVDFSGTPLDKDK